MGCMGVYTRPGRAKGRQKQNHGRIRPGRGAANFLYGPPRTFAKSQTHPPTSRLFPIFGCFSARGVQKDHQIIFAKSSCRKLFPKKSPKILMSSFPCFFKIAVLGVSQRWKLKKKHKKNCPKNRVEFVLPKNRVETFSKTDFSILFIRFLGVFSVRGVQKHHKKISKKQI
jgi:hypothetical protein